MDGIRKNIPEELLTAKDKYRDRADILRNRLDMLRGKDKLLMKMYWENGNSLRQISRLAGINRITIARRINKLTGRLMEGKYITCLRYRERFTVREMAIAKDYFLLDISMKKIAEKRHLSFYNVRQILEKIQQLLATISTESSECKLTDYEN
ncbi:MAG: hypothetical protein ACYSU4_13535 [Planctomycetota bacterium]|jgi:predicted DNA-binding protein YlxM (UPF0122 family)